MTAWRKVKDAFDQVTVPTGISVFKLFEVAGPTDIANPPAVYPVPDTWCDVRLENAVWAPLNDPELERRAIL